MSSSSSSRYPNDRDQNERYPSSSSSRDYRGNTSGRGDTTAPSYSHSSSSSSHHHSSSSSSSNPYGQPTLSSSSSGNRNTSYSSNPRDNNYRDDRYRQRSRSRSRERYRNRSRSRSRDRSTYQPLSTSASSSSSLHVPRNELNNRSSRDSTVTGNKDSKPSVVSAVSGSISNTSRPLTLPVANDTVVPTNTTETKENNHANDNNNDIDNKNNDDDSEFIYEDEETKTARLLEESKKRRQMIVAKYKQNEQTVLPTVVSISSSTTSSLSSTVTSQSVPSTEANSSPPSIPSSSSSMAIPASSTGISIHLGKKSSRFSSTAGTVPNMQNEDEEENDRVDEGTKPFVSRPTTTATPLSLTVSPKQPILSMLDAKKEDILPHLPPSTSTTISRPLSMFDEDNDDDWEKETFVTPKYPSSSSTTTKNNGTNRKGNYGNLNDTMNNDNHNLYDGNDDIEGYYKLRVDEILCGRYRVLGTRGRGVFSSVLFCQDLQAHTVNASTHATAASTTSNANVSSSSSVPDDEQTITDIVTANGELRTSAAPITVTNDGKFIKHTIELATGSFSTVAIKVIRNNDVMHKAALKEIEILKSLATADPTGKYHCVRLLHTFEHNHHTCLVFEPLAMNLKEVQIKYGSGVGLSINAVRNYTKQLLLALGLLAKLHIIHGDIKPHNILANDGFQTIKLADFGSAFSEYDSLNEPAPYLVSRFYRAPEIILGYKHTPGLDMWSVACVLYELHSGKPLFPGINNNDMLMKIQALRGKFPNRMIKRHLHQVQEIGIESHFDEEYRFRCTVYDPITKQPGSKYLTITNPTEDFAGKVLAHKGTEADRRMMNDFIDLLSKMLLLDPVQRITVKDALQHPFIRGHHKSVQG